MKKHVKHIQASEIKNSQTNPIIVNSTTLVHSAHGGDHKSLVTPRNHIHSFLVKKFLMPVTRMRMMTSRMNQFVKRRPRLDLAESTSAGNWTSRHCEASAPSNSMHVVAKKLQTMRVKSANGSSSFLNVQPSRNLLRIVRTNKTLQLTHDELLYNLWYYSVLQLLQRINFKQTNLPFELLEETWNHGSLIGSIFAPFLIPWALPRC